MAIQGHFKNSPCILYFIHCSRELAETSPYYESLKKRDVEVLFCYEMYDELVLLELKEFNNKQLVSIENDMQTATKEETEDIIGLYFAFKPVHGW